MPRSRGFGTSKKRKKVVTLDTPGSEDNNAEEPDTERPSTPPPAPAVPDSPADEEPPGTPGSHEVPAAQSVLSQCAQQVREAREAWLKCVKATDNAKLIHNVICTRLENMPQKLWKRVHENKLDNATAALNAATIAQGEAYSFYLIELYGLQIARIELRDAKLRSLKRRLRRKKVYGLMRWGRRL